MTTTTTTTKLGQVSLTITCATVERCSDEDGHTWISGSVEVSWQRDDYRSDRGEVRIPAGCWLDSDDDHQVWCHDHEGARAIAAVLGGGSEEMIRRAMPEACESLGRMICAELRSEHAAAAAEAM